MRRIAALAGLLALAGCGGGVASQLDGAWHVDPASVSSSRLQPGKEAETVWRAGQTEMSKVTVVFDSGKHTVQASGFGKTSDGTWKLLGTQISVDSDFVWPDLTYDKDTQRIHGEMRKGNDQLKFDLIKS